jgi:Asp-tRNA(Asn)/Glu-tRNA(Gln) amidotransferase A subunit family amidase
VSASTAVERALEAVAARERTVRAWAFLDADRARAEARAVDDRGGGPLAGHVLAVKDVFDTSDQPTSYGSPIYRDHRPAADAAVVAMLRSAGAVCLGKAVTAELACYHPGPTTNPYRATHTPGGSSMGSAAAVACGMATIALGTQTGGSVIRPASFCGVYGLKPTFGTVTVAGMKPVAPSLDTVGWFATTAADLAAVLSVLTARPAPSVNSAPPIIGLARTAQWAQADDDSRASVMEAAQGAKAAGARVVDLELPPLADGLADRHPTLMAYEAARSLAWEYEAHRDELSSDLRQMLATGWAVAVDEVDAIRADAVAARVQVAEALDAVNADVVLTLGVAGEAPATLATTGDPRFARLWTLLGTPAVSVPGLSGSTGMPVGVQLVGRVGDDVRLLEVAGWLGARLAASAGNGAGADLS